MMRVRQKTREVGSSLSRRAESVEQKGERTYWRDTAIPNGRSAC
jgi:hypothetical protein